MSPMPLRDRRLVLEPPGSRRCIAAQLSRDRRRVARKSPGDLAHAELLGTPDGDVLALGEGQETTRDSRSKSWIHPASVTEPPERNR